jgi:hypothetical protein
MDLMRTSRLPARCIVGDCKGLGIVYRRVHATKATVLVKVCRQHAAMYR